MNNPEAFISEEKKSRVVVAKAQMNPQPPAEQKVDLENSKPRDAENPVIFQCPFQRCLLDWALISNNHHSFDKISFIFE